MPPKENEPQTADTLDRGLEERKAGIARHVLRALGQPSDLRAVQVKPLWGDHYRVNVLVGGDFASAKVVQSYFLATDPNGLVITCSPAIAKQY